MGEVTHDQVNDASSFSNVLPYLSLVILACSLAGNVIQGWKLRAINAERIRRTAALAPVRSGQQIDSIEVKDLDGKATQVRFSDQTTVLYIFSPTCHWCSRNAANISSLATTPDVRFVGLSLTSEGLNDYVKKAQLKFPVYTIAGPSELDKLDYRGTPQTVVLSNTGKVERNWPGAYSGSTKVLIESYFGRKLPGLLADPSDPER